MLKNKDYDEMIEPIINIYNKIEMELLLDVARRFKTYDSVSGTLEWYLKKLNDMNALNDAAIKIFAKYSGKSEKAIRKMLNEAQFGALTESEINKAFDMGIAKVTYDDLIQNEAFKATLESSFKELDKSFRLIQTKAIESQKQAYMDVLNKAYIDVSSGTYSYNTSIQNGIKAMAKKGIYGVTYRRKDDKIIHYSIEAAVRRDTLTAVHKLANENAMKSINELGTNYVDVSSHLGARVSDTNPIANHYGWQGKQYQIEGSSSEYPNLVEKTGYGNILGLGGVNCRHRMFPFFPGISTPYAQEYDEEENKEYYEATQTQRKLEREMRALKKDMYCQNTIGNTEGVARIKEQIKKKSNQIDAHCDKYNLKRNYDRERVMEQVV